MVAFASNDYLGLTQHPAVIAAARKLHTTAGRKLSDAEVRSSAANTSKPGSDPEMSAEVVALTVSSGLIWKTPNPS